MPPPRSTAYTIRRQQSQPSDRPPSTPPVDDVSWLPFQSSCFRQTSTPIRRQRASLVPEVVRDPAYRGLELPPRSAAETTPERSVSAGPKDTAEGPGLGRALHMPVADGPEVAAAREAVPPRERNGLSVHGNVGRRPNRGVRVVDGVARETFQREVVDAGGVAKGEYGGRRRLPRPRGGPNTDDTENRRIGGRIPS